uniref:hypothetical protein n=1 Tax=Candidatus Proelusimicrobium excrementi TaxID=3416222 RepID=UPI003D0DF711
HFPQRMCENTFNMSCRLPGDDKVRKVSEYGQHSSGALKCKGREFHPTLHLEKHKKKKKRKRKPKKEKTILKSFLKKTVKLGLSNPEFDNNIFYGAGLFATRPSLRQMFTIDAGFWRQNLLEGGGKAVPGFGFTPGAKIESKYMPVILTPNK